MGQLDHYDTRPAVSWPCLLIDMGGFDFSNMGEKAQTGEGELVLRLADDPYSATTNITPEQVRKKGLFFFELEFALHKALHGWSPGEESGSLIRRSSKPELREDKFRVREMRYRLSFEDYSTKIPYFAAPASDYNDDYDPADYGGERPVLEFRTE